MSQKQSQCAIRLKSPWPLKAVGHLNFYVRRGESDRWATEHTLLMVPLSTIQHQHPGNRIQNHIIQCHVFWKWSLWQNMTHTFVFLMASIFTFPLRQEMLRPSHRFNPGTWRGMVSRAHAYYGTHQVCSLLIQFLMSNYTLLFGANSKCWTSGIGISERTYILL